MYFFKTFAYGIVAIFKGIIKFIKYFFIGLFNVITIIPKYFIFGIMHYLVRKDMLRQQNKIKSYLFV